MTGTAVTAAPAAGALLDGGGAPQASGLTPSELNAFRISAVMDRLAIHVRTNSEDAIEFLNLCLSLARGIDFAIANHEVPSRTQDLPSIVKEVCQNRSEALLQAACMVLMISVKSACESGWFSDRDSEELSKLVKEIATPFVSDSNFKTEPSSSQSIISTVMSRFYPRMKMGHILAFLEVKPGFDAYVSDFKITKNLKSSPGDKIRLFVVQTDSIETSSCLINPAKVNFLLNGKGVERRSTLAMDTGPQIPTLVTHLLKFGTNLLQAVGEFNGNYIIAVAFMSEIPNPDSNTLKDYEQFAPATLDSDSEVIVGKSRISLNCPISFKRIKTPVKGHSCRHIQCFDFDNYVDINSRRPSWRCPHCNQHVCFSDIRIDQKMIKVLKDMPDVSDIIISPDGSWNVLVEKEDTSQKPTEDKPSNKGQDETLEAIDVLDLTQIDDAMDAAPTNEAEEGRNFSNTHQSQLTTQATANINVKKSSQLLTTPASHRETSLPNAVQSQPNQLGNASFPSLPRHVSRTPAAGLALPTRATSILESSRSSVNTSIPSPRPHPVIQQIRASAPARPPQQNRVPNERQQMGPHLRAARPIGPRVAQSPLQPPSGSFSRPQNHTRVPLGRPVHRPTVVTTQSELIAAANRTMQMAVDGRSAPLPVDPRGSMGISSQPVTRTNTGIPSQPVSGTNTGIPSQPVTSTNAGISSQPTTGTEMDWRPAGRMRGALSGQAYADALNQFITSRPNQQAPAARPNSNVNSPSTQLPNSSCAGTGPAS